MPRLILLNKPFGVLCQFGPAEGQRTLKDFVPVPAVYPAGRLDADSEGLVVLTDDGRLQAAIADPRHKLEKGYWVQVEGTPTEAALERLRRGLALPDGPTRPAAVRTIPEPPGLWARDPPIRVRKAIPTAWLELGLTRGAQPPGAAHDRRDRPADAAPGAFPRRAVGPGRAATRAVARGPGARFTRPPSGILTSSRASGVNPRIMRDVNVATRLIPAQSKH